jgi:FtsK/SpoIIIE family
VNGWGGGYRPPTWCQPVGWGALHETPPIVTAPVVRESPTDWLFNGILRPAWAYRLELTLIAVVAAAYLWLGERLGRQDAERLIVAAAFLVAMVTWTREPLAHALFRSHLRRRWALACRHAELATPNDRIPRITRCRLTRAGEQLRVRVPAGSQVPDLEAQAERIAAFLSVREVRVVRDPASARHAKVIVLRRDPLADPTPTPWPLVTANRLSLWQPIPVGTDEDGSPVTVTLPERNLLLGGEPGAGKSNVLQLLVAVGALDPTVRLTLFDPKLVELAVWQGSAARLVGPNVEEAIEVLKQLISELDDRYLTPARQPGQEGHRGRRPAAAPGRDRGAGVLHQRPDRKAAQAFSTLLRDFLARGRAAGMVTVATTQKPSADVVPTFLRDLFGFRWALRCSTPQASDTILGSGWASEGYPAARGVGLLLQEGGVPVRLRSCYLDDLDLTELARRAEVLRGTIRTATTATLRLVEDESA